MYRQLITLFLFIGQLFFAQDIDTSLVIQTPKSEMKLTCIKKFDDGNVIESSVFFNVIIKINDGTINEAVSSGIKKGTYYVALHYDENCNLDSVSTIKPSVNVSFNLEMSKYFEEFIQAYNSNDLKKYFIESSGDCGGGRLSFTYYVE